MAQTTLENPAQPKTSKKDKTLAEPNAALERNNGRPVAIVTGGVRGIGRAIAEELMAAGYQVVVTYRSSGDSAQKMLEDFQEQNLVARKTDVALQEDVNELFDYVDSHFGRLDVLINNAGITQDRTFHKMDRDDWQHVMDVNLNGSFYCCNRAIPMMREQQFGRIVNISSIVGQKGNFGQANYAASKAGMIGLTKTLALETATKGITVNAVCPGFIETDMVGAIPDEVQMKIKSEIPMHRFGRTQEVAKAVRFLISEDASYITGQELNVNGGLLTH